MNENRYIELCKHAIGMGMRKPYGTERRFTGRTETTLRRAKDTVTLKRGKSLKPQDTRSLYSVKSTGKCSG